MPVKKAPTYKKFLEELKLGDKKDKVTVNLNSHMSQSDYCEIEDVLSQFDRKLIDQYVIQKHSRTIINGLDSAELFELLDDFDMINYFCLNHKDRVIEELEKYQ